jgi:hypothetical protein
MQIEVVSLEVETTLFVNSGLVYEYFIACCSTHVLHNELNFLKYKL